MFECLQVELECRMHKSDMMSHDCIMEREQINQTIHNIRTRRSDRGMMKWFRDGEKTWNPSVLEKGKSATGKRGGDNSLKTHKARVVFVGRWSVRFWKTQHFLPDRCTARPYYVYDFLMATHLAVCQVWRFLLLADKPVRFFIFMAKGQ